MLDFFIITTKSNKNVTEVYPNFIVKNKTEDLMIRGGDFYAVWVEERGLWSTDEQDVLDIIDRELTRYVNEHKESLGGNVRVKYMWDASSGMIDQWHKYCQKQMRDSYHTLDESVIFSNTEVTKKTYASRKLPYPLEKGPCPAYDRIMSVLYEPEERRKIEWAIGAIIEGDSKFIQKFLVLYGAAGTGKSTVLNIIQNLFEGYFSVFDAKALGSSSNVFALEAFKSNPLVAIQHDGDLSHIEDNTRLNSLVSHEIMTINEKFKSTYSNQFKSFLFMGTNKPVKITDAKSGILRRLIDVHPSGRKLSIKEYRDVTKKVSFELGAIAAHCLDVYLDDPGRYDSYVPTQMFEATNDFYNYVSEMFFSFKDENAVTLKSAWERYNTYCAEAKVPYPLSQRAFKEELKNYFVDYYERITLDDGTRVRSYFKGFRADKFDASYTDVVPEEKPAEQDSWLNLKEGQPSIFDDECKDCSAQYASSQETPIKKWEKVTTTLSDLDTSKLHYVKVPENHIVIDFDIKDENGDKSYDLNAAAVSSWPATYAELSKGGAGIHLHYIYSGDVTELSRIYNDSVEIKVFTGNSSLRRKLTKCNELPIAVLSSGLPLKGVKKMINKEVVLSEKGLRTTIKKCLDGGVHGHTKPNIDYIYKLLNDYYNSGQPYDVSDLKHKVLVYAMKSTNNADYCVKMVNKMPFKSEEHSEPAKSEKKELIFYDVEVFPNLFLVNWKFPGEDKPVVRMINPKPHEIEDLIKYNLIGFNCRRYDNHMLYACLIGYNNQQIYNLSQSIINDGKGFFGEAYNISYTDIFDFAATKQSLKKWEIEMNIHHQELGLPWDQPVPEEKWEEVAEYCDNDVIATEALFNHLKGDWTARQILAELAGLSVNETTNTLTTRIIFGSDKKPELVYTDLATGEQYGPGAETKEFNKFPGYTYENGKNMFRDVDVGRGGYVYSKPGTYGNVALLDVASLHPHSIIAMNCFGKYTKNFEDILHARMYIKHKEFDKARDMLDGKLAPYLDDEGTAKDLAQALKIAINSVYGLTSASFTNPFKDLRNKNNIVALRGALFMKTLQDEVTSRGYEVIHIKTDSIKIADADQRIIDFCMGFASDYGYTFEHEATYDRICLVNKAVYIAKYSDDDVNGSHKGQWTATGKQFAVPYVFKTLFSKEDVVFEDLCETFEVKTALYLDMNESLPEGEHDRYFIGKVGQFSPIRPGAGGGILQRQALDKEGNVKYDSATGADGYRWLESESVRLLNKQGDIDISYYDSLATDAIKAISEHGDYEWLVSDDPYVPIPMESPPWEDDDFYPYDVR